METPGQSVNATLDYIEKGDLEYELVAFVIDAIHALKGESYLDEANDLAIDLRECLALGLERNHQEMYPDQPEIELPAELAQLIYRLKMNLPCDVMLTPNEASQTLSVGIPTAEYPPSPDSLNGVNDNAAFGVTEQTRWGLTGALAN